MTAALTTLNDAVPDLEWLEIASRKAGPIKLTPLDAAPDPARFGRRCWPSG
jgi:hypothetical protein